MHPSPSILVKRALPGPLALQGFVVLAALVFALSPVHGGTAIYLPVAGGGMTNTIEWSREHGASLIAPGPYEGAFIVRTGAQVNITAALSNGALLISVPEFLCGSTGSNVVAKQ
ncbi:hypothetical protein [Novosphingobium album (ex Hu et al. 2023)]|uniref:Uncharacterized protein n=1 Tax=Novosphingobium album (ex Hu et al. 2023) TaxID=2930093 RepID=A0ABT0AX35_9SPHN|nr:hypothetical protein [Novosphingobium album (ex Hu et al. 2023)]MCJ2177379.1 hypothetical protein [Novosphingobium album (ex Hu et al. 2023)]